MLHLLPWALRSRNPVPTVMMMFLSLLWLANFSLCLGGVWPSTCARPNTDLSLPVAAAVADAAAVVDAAVAVATTSSAAAATRCY